jgi:hypothetical protein
MPIFSKPWQPRPPGTLRTSPGMHWDSFITPMFKSSLPFRQEPSKEPILKQPTIPHNSLFNIYFNILKSRKARSAKPCLPFRCQLNSEQLHLSSLLCLFHVRSSSGPGPPRPISNPGKEIYSGPSSIGTVILSRFVLAAAVRDGRLG